MAAAALENNHSAQKPSSHTKKQPKSSSSATDLPFDNHNGRARRRWAALVISLCGVGFLLLRIHVASLRAGSLAQGLGFLSHFFTILTNTAVSLAMGWTAHQERTAVTLRNKNSSSEPRGGGRGIAITPLVWLALVSAILGVGIVYHVALKHLRTLPPGLEKVADEGVHTVIPLLALAWWMLFEHRPVEFWAGFKACIVWPAGYGIYILIRANLFGGFYPYPFLNLPKIGLAQFAVNVLVLGLVFGTLGLGLLFAKQQIRKMYSKPNAD